MRRVILFVLCLGLFTILLGCGKNGLTVTIGGKETKVDKTTSVAIIRPDLRQLQVLVANYQVDLSKNIMGAPQTSKPGEVKVAFYIKGDGKEFKKPVEPGEYSAEKIEAAYVSKDGASSDVSFQRSDKHATGKIVIESIDDKTVKGSIDIKNGDDSIVGPFEAKLIPDK